MKLIGGRSRSRKQNAVEVARQHFTATAIECSTELIDLFNDAVNKSFKSDISNALHHDRVAKSLMEVDIDQHLSIDNCHRVFKRCYGWKTWLYAPEDGIRGMIREGIAAYYAPLQGILKDVHDLTLSALEMSLEEATTLQAPGNETLKQVMEDQAVESINSWRDSTWQQLSANLHAEHEFPAPQTFRRLKSSIDSLLEHEANAQAERLIEHYRNMIDVAMKRMSMSDLRRRELSSHALPGALVGEGGEGGKGVAGKPPAVGEFYMGWLEKKNRFGKWQRRWVVLSPEKRRLYYFAQPEEDHARGAATLVGCHVFPEVFEDGEYDDMAFKLVFKQEDGKQQSLLSDLGLGGTKPVVALTLRASSAGTKEEWLDMIGKCILGKIRDKHTTPGVDIVADSSSAAGDVGDVGTGKAERKISSQVFAEDGGATADDQSKAPAEERRRPKRRNKSVVSFSIVSRGEVEEADDEKEGDAHGDDRDEECGGETPASSAEIISAEALAEEMALFEEVTAQADRAVPTAEEAMMLECIAQAVREYMVDCQRLIVEQASKIIKDGMLPFKHARELHADLLKAVLAD